MDMRKCIPGTRAMGGDYNATVYEMMNSTTPLVEFPAWEIALKVVFYVIAMLMDIVGNSIVLLIVLLNRKMRTSTNVLLLNLAVSDLLVGMFCMWVHLGNRISSVYPFGSFMCKFSTFAQVMSLTASVLSLTVISVERLIAVVWPFRHRWSPATLVVIVGCTWLAAILTASPQLFVRELYVFRWRDRSDIYCAENWPYYYKDTKCEKWQPGKVIYYMIEGIVMYFIPVTIMIVTYSMIAFKLLMRRSTGLLIGTTSLNQKKAKRKVTKMLAVVLVAFIICWTPQQALLLYELFYHPNQTGPFMAGKYMAVFIAYTNSALNPILYGRFNDNFRKGFLEAFRCILVQKINKIGTERTVSNVINTDRDSNNINVISRSQMHPQAVSTITASLAASNNGSPRLELTAPDAPAMDHEEINI